MVLILALQESSHSPLMLIAVATIGNTLGGLITFAMGWYGLSHFNWLPAMIRQRQVMPYLQRYGWLGLILSWVPVFGDALCLVAGWLRLPPLLSSGAMLAGKMCRYSLLTWLYHMA